VTKPADIEVLLEEYEVARQFTRSLYEDLTEREILWRPSPQSSGIGWHLGHQAAVNHFLVRNLVAAEASLAPAFDALFDSATQEPERGALPAVGDLLAYREAVAVRTRARIQAILRGDVGAPAQLRHVAVSLLVALVNHEYQHDCWIGEVRAALGQSDPAPPASARLTAVDGYWTLTGI